jgi:hypothetical protein
VNAVDIYERVLPADCVSWRDCVGGILPII